MADKEFDYPGLGKARMALTALAKDATTSGRGRARAFKKALTQELYVEIRAARKTKHSWKVIRQALVKNVSIKISERCLARLFNEIDIEWERETGEPRVGEIYRRRGRQKPKIKDA